MKHVAQMEKKPVHEGKEALTQRYKNWPMRSWCTYDIRCKKAPGLVGFKLNKYYLL
jgi:hypothetical protein